MRRVAFAVTIAIAACGVDETVLRKLEATPVVPVVDAGQSDAPVSVVVPPNASDVYDVALGQGFSCALARGLGFCWGANVQGSLGTGDAQDRLVPAPIAGSRVFDVLAAGDLHACGIERESGRVLCWGSNSRGQLGQGNKTSKVVPTEVALPSPAASISAGYGHSCAVLRSGELFCWGNNEEGQIGTSEFTADVERLVPTRVDETDWIAVAGGQGQTCGLRRGGASASLWCWGRNSANDSGLGPGAPGQVRVPNRVGTLDDWKSIDCGQGGGCGIATDGSLRCWGGSVDSPTPVGTDRDWAAVSFDLFASCGVTTQKKLRCWGRNVEGQLGTGDWADRATPAEIPGEWSAVSVGRFHACALASDRSIRCTGANDTGQLGLGNNERRNVFTAVSIPISAPE